MSYRRWMFTINNYTNQDEIEAQNLLCTYLMYGREIAPTTGTPHMQGFVVFANTRRFSAVSRLFGGRAHWDAARGTNQEAFDYCSKDGDIVEYGTMPMRGRSTAYSACCQEVLGGVQPNDIARTNPEVFVRYGRGLRDLCNAVSTPYEHTDVRGIWIVGRPGTGKSRYARDTYKDSLYLKQQNKWFDNYNGEETILLDDFDKAGDCLGHHLKIWTDRYACTGETKGSQVCLKHHRFVVTTNYTINELFGSDREMYRALLRRFTVLNFDVTPYHPAPAEEVQIWEPPINNDIDENLLRDVINQVWHEVAENGDVTEENVLN